MFDSLAVREELRDTLYLLGINYTRDKVKNPKGKGVIFILEWPRNMIRIYNGRFIMLNNQRFNSSYEMKLELMKRYLDV